MDIVAMIAESKIKEAIANGDLDNLPNKGQPLIMEDLSSIPSELRAGYKILKNAGVLPEELQIRKDMITLQDLIDCCNDEKEKIKLRKRLNEKLLRFNILMEKKKISCNVELYKNKIYEKLGGI